MSSNEPRIVDHQGVTTAVVEGVVAVAEIAQFYDHAFSTVAQRAAEQGVELAGPAFSLMHSPPGDTFDIEVGFPTDRRVVEGDGLVASTLPEGRVAFLEHVGSYDELGGSWERLSAWMDTEGLIKGDRPWEVYVTEPRPDMDPADLRTELFWPIG